MTHKPNQFINTDETVYVRYNRQHIKSPHSIGARLARQFGSSAVRHYFAYVHWPTFVWCACNRVGSSFKHPLFHRVISGHIRVPYLDIKASMPRILRSSSQRKRSQWHHTLQSIKNLVPTISAKPTHPTETLDQREFLAVLHLMPVKYTVKPIFTHGSKEAKKCREWCDQMDQYCLKRDIDIGT